MRKFSIFITLSLALFADDFEMFDRLDKEDKSSKTISESTLNADVKMSTLLQDNQDNENRLFLNVNENRKNYVYDIRIVADEDKQHLYIKDLYLKEKIDDKYFFELGRINVKEGIANGYNPTDHFKGGASDLTISIDPKDQKDNRLGAVMFQMTAILDNYTIKALYSPKITEKEDSLGTNKKYIGLNLNSSNNQDRASLYVGYTGLENTSLSTILHHNDNGVNVGANISYIDDKSIWYLEGSIYRGSGAMYQTLNEMGSPSEIRELFSSQKSYQSELAIGWNYTSEDSFVSTLEYIYNSDGLSKSKSDKLNELKNHNPQYAQLIGGLKGKTAQKGKRLSRNSLFLMTRKSDIRPNIDWTLMSWIDVDDRSSLIQTGVVNSSSENWVYSTDARAYIGNRNSEYGSYANEFELLMNIQYLF